MKIAPHLARTALGLAVATSSALLASCQGCEEERPYTPFTVSVPEAATTDAEAAAGPDAASSPAAEADAGSFVRQKSVKAPPGARSWQLEGRDLQAPDGRVFERALLADFDADGEPEAVAWLAPADDRARTSPGELWLYRTSGNPPGTAREKPRHLATLPGFVPTGPTCRLSPELTRTGRKTVTLDVRSTCEADLVERSPVRALLVVAPLAEQPIVLGLRVAEPAPGERLSLDVDTSDRDDDQRDDVRLRISLQAEGSERPATADVVWFDRAAGIARDPEQPGRSLAKQASLEAVRSTGKKTSQSVPDAVSNLRRLLGTLCAEGGVPRIFDADGTPLRCGDLQITVNRLALAEVQAHVTARRPLDAVSAVIRADWYLQANNEPEKLRAALAPVLDQSPADTRLLATPRTYRRGNEPRYSPLAFDADGTLRVQTPGATVVRLSAEGEPLDTGDAGADAPPPPAPWPLEVRSAAGRRWTGVAYACDRSEIALTFSEPGAPPPAPQATTLLSPRPGACAGGSGPRALAPAPIAFTDQLQAIVAGALVGPEPKGAALPGSARSPDGRHLVALTPLGLLVTGERTQLWTLPGEVDPKQLGDCVVANGGQRVACVQGAAVRLFERRR